MGHHLAATLVGVPAAGAETPAAVTLYRLNQPPGCELAEAWPAPVMPAVGLG
jgi:hypothetical protein